MLLGLIKPEKHNLFTCSASRDATFLPRQEFISRSNASTDLYANLCLGQPTNFNQLNSLLGLNLYTQTMTHIQNPCAHTILTCIIF